MSELAATQTLGKAAPKRKRSNFLLRLGPGLITGAADDDPSGIGTYSQVGSQFGMGMLWTMLFSFPLMAAIQEICGRLGRTTGAGIAANLRNHYPKPILYGIVLVLCAANIFNLGADISAMGAAAQLVRWQSERLRTRFWRFLAPSSIPVALSTVCPVSEMAYREPVCLRCHRVHRPCAMDHRNSFHRRSQRVVERRLLDGIGRGARHDHQSIFVFLADFRRSGRGPN